MKNVGLKAIVAVFFLTVAGGLAARAARVRRHRQGSCRVAGELERERRRPTRRLAEGRRRGWIRPHIARVPSGEADAAVFLHSQGIPGRVAWIKMHLPQGMKRL